MESASNTKMASEVIEEIKEHPDQPGSHSIQDGKLKFACANGYIYPKLVQAEGKRRMEVEEFLRGWRD